MSIFTLTTFMFLFILLYCAGTFTPLDDGKGIDMELFLLMSAFVVVMTFLFWKRSKKAARMSPLFPTFFLALTLTLLTSAYTKTPLILLAGIAVLWHWYQLAKNDYRTTEHQKIYILDRIDAKGYVWLYEEDGDANTHSIPYYRIRDLRMYLPEWESKKVELTIIGYQNALWLFSQKIKKIIDLGTGEVLYPEQGPRQQ